MGIREILRRSCYCITNRILHIKADVSNRCDGDIVKRYSTIEVKRKVPAREVQISREELLVALRDPIGLVEGAVDANRSDIFTVDEVRKQQVLPRQLLIPVGHGEGSTP